MKTKLSVLLIVVALAPSLYAKEGAKEDVKNQAQAQEVDLTAEPSLELSQLSAQQLAQRIVDRPANAGRTGEMLFAMRNKKGRKRERAAVLLYADHPDVTKLAIHFTAPAAIRDTGFLSHNADDGPDQSWLYLPATDRVRRLPASDRGDYFMGTDLTYGDLQDNFKFALDDWSFTSVGSEQREEKTLIELVGEAQETARKPMGYSSFRALIDPATLFPVFVVYCDVDGEPLKQIEILQQEQVDGVWTATRFAIQNLQTGHFTEVVLRNMRSVPDLDMSRLESSSLDMGAPDLG